MRRRRFRIRTLMISIAFLALWLTIIMQTFRLQREAVRQEWLRAEAEAQRAQALRAQAQSIRFFSRSRSGKARQPPWNANSRDENRILVGLISLPTRACRSPSGDRTG